MLNIERGTGDADGERHQRDRGQPRRATQRARGVAHVVGEMLQRGQALLLAVPLLERLDAAKGQQRRTASCRRATGPGVCGRRCGAGGGFQSRRPARARADPFGTSPPRDSSTRVAVSRRPPAGCGPALLWLCHTRVARVVWESNRKTLAATCRTPESRKHLPETSTDPRPATPETSRRRSRFRWYRLCSGPWRRSVDAAAASPPVRSLGFDAAALGLRRRGRIRPRLQPHARRPHHPRRPPAR